MPPTGEDILNKVYDGTNLDLATKVRQLAAALAAADAMASPTTAPVLAHQMVYTGALAAAWDRVRRASWVNNLRLTAAIAQTIRTPASGKKIRVAGYIIFLTGNAAIAGGAAVIQVVLTDGGVDASNMWDVHIPQTAVLTDPAGNVTTGYVDLGQGYLSTAANNVIGARLTTALTTGEVLVMLFGMEE